MAKRNARQEKIPRTGTPAPGDKVEGVNMALFSCVARLAAGLSRVSPLGPSHPASRAWRLSRRLQLTRVEGHKLHVLREQELRVPTPVRCC